MNRTQFLRSMSLILLIKLVDVPLEVMISMRDGVHGGGKVQQL